MHIKKIVFSFVFLLSGSYLSPAICLPFLDSACNTSGPGAKCLTPKGALACLKKEFSTSGKGKEFISNIVPGDAYFFVSGKKLYINHENKRFAYDVKNENCLKKLHKKQYLLSGELEVFDFAEYIGVRPVSQTERAEEKFALNSWMSDLHAQIKDKKFVDLWLPGSHDSGTSKISFLSRIAANQDIPKFLNKLTYAGVGFAVEKIIANWARAQSLTIAEQLKAGVRYLDIRLAYRNSSKEFWTVHTQYGQKFSQILDEIFIFLARNPKEIIAIDIQDVQDHYVDRNGKDQNFGYSRELNQMINDRLSGIKMAASEDLSSSIDSLWQKNIQVFLFAEKAQFKGSIAIERKKNLRSDWHNASTIPEFESKYFSYMTGLLEQKTETHDGLFVHQMVLTPGTDEIVAGLKPTANISNLEELTRSFSASLSKYLNALSKVNMPGGVFMVDFVGPKRVEEVVRLNLR